MVWAECPRVKCAENIGEERPAPVLWIGIAAAFCGKKAPPLAGLSVDPLPPMLMTPPKAGLCPRKWFSKLGVGKIKVRLDNCDFRRVNWDNLGTGEIYYPGADGKSLKKEASNEDEKEVFDEHRQYLYFGIGHYRSGAGF